MRLKGVSFILLKFALYVFSLLMHIVPFALFCWLEMQFEDVTSDFIETKIHIPIDLCLKSEKAAAKNSIDFIEMIWLYGFFYKEYKLMLLLFNALLSIKLLVQSQLHAGWLTCLK